MIIAIKLHPDIVDTKLPEQSENSMQFAIIEKDGASESLSFDATIKKDIARSLIAHNIDVLITHDISLEAYVMLKSYGIRVYAAIMGPMSFSTLLEALEEGKLTEITPGNFHAVSHPGKPNVVECTPSAPAATLIGKEAL